MSVRDAVEVAESVERSVGRLLEGMENVSGQLSESSNRQGRLDARVDKIEEAMGMRMRAVEAQLNKAIGMGKMFFIVLSILTALPTVMKLLPAP